MKNYENLLASTIDALLSMYFINGFSLRQKGRVLTIFHDNWKKTRRLDTTKHYNIITFSQYKL